ncbi:MAG: signal peptidase I [candidate division WOR-3 bacterium]
MKCPKCGWGNLPGAKECLQCGSTLDALTEIEVYPPRSKKKSKVKREKFAKRTTGTEQPIADSLSFLLRYTRKSVKFVSKVAPVYSKILLVLIAGFIPGFIQILQKRYNNGLLFISTALLLFVLFFVFITNIASNFFLYLLIALILYSSYDAVIHYYKIKNYILTPIVRVGIILSSVSIGFLLYSIFLIMFNIFYLRVTIPTESLAPTFMKGDEILINRRAYQNKLPQRGDIVAAKHEYITTIERIIGIPGDEISIIQGKIFVNGNEISNTAGPLAQVRNITASISLPDSSYFLFAYFLYNSGAQLVKFHLRDILGKAVVIINPPERRGFIQ